MAIDLSGQSAGAVTGGTSDNQVATETAPPFDVQPNVSNHFAWLRTLLGLQRTLLAAVRTAVSLIGFGFTVAQFFQRLQGPVADGVPKLAPELPRDLGLVLIATGVVSLAAFTWQYHTAVAYLKSGPFSVIAVSSGKPLHNSVNLITSVVMAIGVAAFGSVFIRF